MDYSVISPPNESFSALPHPIGLAPTSDKRTRISARELRNLPKEERSAMLQSMFREAALHFTDDDIAKDNSDILDH